MLPGDIAFWMPLILTMLAALTLLSVLLMAPEKVMIQTWHEPETGLSKGPYHMNLEIDNYYQPFNISWSSAVSVDKGGLLGLDSMPLYLD